MAAQAVNPLEPDTYCSSSSTFGFGFRDPKPSLAATKKRKRKADQTLNAMEEEILVKKFKAFTEVVAEKPELIPRKLVDEKTETVEFDGFIGMDKADHQVVQKQPMEETSETIKFKGLTRLGRAEIAQNKLIEELTVKFKAFTGVGRRLDGEPSRKSQREETDLKKEKEKFQPFTGRSYRLIDYRS